MATKRRARKASNEYEQLWNGFRRLGTGAQVVVAILVVIGLAAMWYTQRNKTTEVSSSPTNTSSIETQNTIGGENGNCPGQVSVVAPKEWSVDAVNANAALSQLVVADETSQKCYDRDQWKHWVDTDGDGCDSREQALIREAELGSVQRDTSSCYVVVADWVSLYDSVTTDDRTQVQVDHIVALSETNRSGGAGWDLETKKLYANDMFGLIAVSGNSNQEKSDYDAALWRPGSCSTGAPELCLGSETTTWQGTVDDGAQAYATKDWCWFATKVIGVKTRWSLAVDPAEKAALQEMLGYC